MNTCKNCAHCGTPSYKSPCSECGYFDKWEEQKVKETGAFSKGVNKGLNIAISAIKNPQICPTIEQPTWISCAERLPEKWQGVLVYRKGNGMTIELLLSTGRWSEDGNSCTPVTHWMPLPSTEGLK